MPRKKPDEAYLRDMLDMARVVVRLTHARTFDDYARDEQVRLAVERAVMIIGEAARHVSTEIQERHPEIPWTKIMRQRHRLVHDYDDIDDVLIWRVAIEHIPALIPLIEPLIPEPPAE